MTDLAIVGLDLSLTSTGIARVGGKVWADRIVPRNMAGHQRMSFILAEIVSLVSDADLVVVEGPAYAVKAAQQGHHERAGLWWLVTRRLWKLGHPYAVVAPTCLKRYATGKGNASKDQVLSAVVRRYRDVDVDANDQADALVLAAMGADYLGRPIAPVAAINRQSLNAVTWPALKRRAA